MKTNIPFFTEEEREEYLQYLEKCNAKLVGIIDKARLKKETIGESDTELLLLLSREPYNLEREKE